MHLRKLRTPLSVVLALALVSCSVNNGGDTNQCDLGLISSTPIYRAYHSGDLRRSLELIRAGSCGADDHTLVGMVYSVAVLSDPQSVTALEIDRYVGLARASNQKGGTFHDAGYLLVAAHRYEEAKQFFIEAKQIRPERHRIEEVRLRAVERGLKYGLPPTEVLSEIVSNLEESGFRRDFDVTFDGSS